ncbi:Presilphiperfolan-8-beta-ol synthase [Xylaria acuta]|nr:Presilphiperfolan-8-beta-ol synthase [Xylaria acuta]
MVTPKANPESAIELPSPKSDCSVSSQLPETQLKLELDITTAIQTVQQPGNEQEKRRCVRVPDLFSSIMAAKPVVNSNYFQVKPEGDRWIGQIMNMDEKASDRNTRADLCYMASIWSPTSNEEALRMMLDWNHWVILFDDQFDEGHLKNDLVAAQAEIDATMAIMTDDAPLIKPSENPIRYVFQTCWQRLKRRASLELQQRFREQHRRYFEQLAAQVQRAASGEVLMTDVDTYMEMRRGTIGVYPAIALSEYGHEIKLPEHIFSHSSLQECMRVSTDLVLLVNDLLSYRKDLELGFNYNLISIPQQNGLSIQHSIDQIGAMMTDCYRRWYMALVELPSYGQEIDSEVLKFVDVCRFVALGKLHWSFKSGRYLGNEGYGVYKTKILPLFRE